MPEPEYPSTPHGYAAFWRARLENPAFVYVMEGDPGGPIKVGRAKDPWARARDLQTGHPYLLRVLHVVPGDSRLEWRLHHRLKESRTHGEWFHGPAIPIFLEFIANLARQMIEHEQPDHTRFDLWPLDKDRPDCTVRYLGESEPLSPMPPAVPPAIARERYEEFLYSRGRTPAQSPVLAPLRKAS